MKAVASLRVVDFSLGHAVRFAKSQSRGLNRLAVSRCRAFIDGLLEMLSLLESQFPFVRSSESLSCHRDEKQPSI